MDTPTTRREARARAGHPRHAAPTDPQERRARLRDLALVLGAVTPALTAMAALITAIGGLW